LRGSLETNEKKEKKEKRNKRFFRFNSKKNRKTRMDNTKRNKKYSGIEKMITFYRKMGGHWEGLGGREGDGDIIAVRDLGIKIEK